MKLLVAGPPGAGKTAALRAIAGAAPVSIAVPLVEDAGQGTHTTAASFDYGTIDLGDRAALHVYGLPGQGGLDFMHTIMARGALGAMILLDATSATLTADCAYWLETLIRINPELKFVIGVSKIDHAPDFSIADVRAGVLQAGVSAPVLTVDPRDPARVRQLVRVLLLTL